MKKKNEQSKKKKEKSNVISFEKHRIQQEKKQNESERNKYLLVFEFFEIKLEEARRFSKPIGREGIYERKLSLIMELANLDIEDKDEKYEDWLYALLKRIEWHASQADEIKEMDSESESEPDCDSELEPESDSDSEPKD